MSSCCLVYKPRKEKKRSRRRRSPVSSILLLLPFVFCNIQMNDIHAARSGAERSAVGINAHLMPTCPCACVSCVCVWLLKPEGTITPSSTILLQGWGHIWPTNSFFFWGGMKYLEQKKARPFFTESCSRASIRQGWDSHPQIRLSLTRFGLNVSNWAERANV